MHFAANSGHAAVVEVLLEHRASIEAKNEFGPGVSQYLMARFLQATLTSTELLASDVCDISPTNHEASFVAAAV